MIREIENLKNETCPECRKVQPTVVEFNFGTRFVVCTECVLKPLGVEEDEEDEEDVDSD